MITSVSPPNMNLLKEKKTLVKRISVSYFHFLTQLISKTYLCYTCPESAVSKSMLKTAMIFCHTLPNTYMLMYTWLVNKSPPSAIAVCDLYSTPGEKHVLSGWTSSQTTALFHTSRPMQISTQFLRNWKYITDESAWWIPELLSQLEKSLHINCLPEEKKTDLKENS